MSLIEQSDMEIYHAIHQIMSVARRKAYSAVNFVMVEAYWNVGLIIHKAQHQSQRAEYGQALLAFLSKQLTAEFGKGFTRRNLSNMRAFYMAFPEWEMVSPNLSWTHYRLLLSVQNKIERTFYFEECSKSMWSTRQLERQINTFYYQRLLASRDKKAVSQEIHQVEKPISPKDIIRDPYVLEFLGLQHTANLYEKDLEQALINHLQKFLLELGRGFSFVARQQRISFDGEHYFIDLVFYNYILKCFVIIDLKVGKLTHQDIGQMQMYVNYYTREMMNEGDNPPIGIILSASKSESVVKYTLPEN
ncbi:MULTISPECIES: YhcG family protein [Glaesserella]|uniref:PDDEXK nuclease domain-containing protein n=1 Tax=Glaesserella TaxID=2094023 RepID=UPI001EDF90C5|nr:MULTISPECIES: PDDEXK nuclease domain-containing protein [Glaesserella]